MLEKIIWKGRMASLYLGKIKKIEKMQTYKKKYTIKKLMGYFFFNDSTIPKIDIIPIINTGK